MTRFISAVLGAFIPPVGVFMLKGLGAAFWINVLLSLLFYVPGQLHAMWVVAHTRSDGRPRNNGISTFIGLLVSWVLPPLAVLVKRGFGLQLLLNLVLTLFFVVPGSIHAVWITIED